MGRRTFEKTFDLTDHASYLARFGVSERDIAATLKIDRKTLRKYFAAEIAAARVASRVEILKDIHTRAIRGHLPSSLAMLKLLGSPTADKKSPPPAVARPTGTEPEPEKE
jgi:hypothetical protein